MEVKDLTVCTCLLLLSAANAILFSDCGSMNGTMIRKVQLLDCENLDVCELVRRTTTTLDVDFETNSNATEINMRISGQIQGVFIPFAFSQKDACQRSGLSCPLQPGKSYTYHAEVDVKNSFPPIEVGLRFKLVPIGIKEPIFCILIPARIV